MKLLILSNSDVGLFKFRNELILELLKHNEVYISLPYGSFIDVMKEEGCKFIKTNVNRRGINPLKDIYLLFDYYRIVRKTKPDLVITYTIKPNIYGGIVCKTKSIPYVTNITGLGTAFEEDNWLQKLVTILYRFALKRAKVVFFENSENKRIFEAKMIVKKQQSYLLNGAGVNTDYYSYLEYPNNDVFRFLFIGRVMREKGIDELLEAMKLFVKESNPCVLDLVGPMEEDYQEEVSQGVKEGWLNYHGYQEDVKPFIKQCDCFVLPSWHEGMANTNLECASSGRPIITSNIPGCKEAVVDGVSGFLCEAKKTASLFESMKNIYNTVVDQRRDMGMEGRKHVIKYFNKENVVKATIKAMEV